MKTATSSIWWVISTCTNTVFLNQNFCSDDSIETSKSGFWSFSAIHANGQGVSLIQLNHSQNLRALFYCCLVGLHGSFDEIRQIFRAFRNRPATDSTWNLSFFKIRPTKRLMLRIFRDTTFYLIRIGRSWRFVPKRKWLTLLGIPILNCFITALVVSWNLANPSRAN